MIVEHPDGCVLLVRAQPGSRKNEIRTVQNGELKVAVTPVPEKGKANKAIVELLAKELGIRKSAIELIAGPLSPQKQFLLHGVTPKELREKMGDRG
ncbi:MAG: DUF167 domain-containing protein [Thermoguttaceae bacterium]